MTREEYTKQVIEMNDKELETQLNNHKWLKGNLEHELSSCVAKVITLILEKNRRAKC